MAGDQPGGQRVHVASGRGRQGDREVELHGGQRHTPPGQVDLAAGQIHDQVVEHQPLARHPGSAPTAQHRRDPGDDLAGAERFGDVVVGATASPTRLSVSWARSDKHDVDVREGPRPAQGLDSVKVGQHHIEQHEVEGATPGLGDRPPADQLVGACRARASTEPVMEPVVDPVIEPVIESVPAPSIDPVIELDIDPVMERLIEPATAPPAL